MRPRPSRPVAIATGLLAATLALFPAASSAQSPTPATTPEDAVTTYLGAVAAGDAEAILAASAVNEMAAGFDFQANAERLGVMALVTGLAPSEYPLFAEANRYQQASWILGQVRNLVYGLFSGEVIDGTVIAPADAERIAAFVAAVDPSRLAGLTVEEVRLPRPEISTSERNLANSAAQAAIYGADEQTERLALVSLDGATYAIGATLLRYGDAWKVASQTSIIGGTTLFGTAEPMSRAQYDEITGA